MAAYKTKELSAVTYQNEYLPQVQMQTPPEPTAPIYEHTTFSNAAVSEHAPAPRSIQKADTVYQNQAVPAHKPALPPRTSAISQPSTKSFPDSKSRCALALLSTCFVLLVVVGAVAVVALLRKPETEQIVKIIEKLQEERKNLSETEDPALFSQSVPETEQLKNILEKLQEERKDTLYRLPGATCIGVDWGDEPNVWNQTIGSMRTIYPPGLDRGIDVYCDSSDGGGWIVLQYRTGRDSVSFQRWSDYINGFGNVNEYWIGLENMHKLTSDAEYELRVDLEDWCDETAYATYFNFFVGGSEENYKLQISGYNGTAGNSLASSNDREFSTFSYGASCSTRRRYGGWWFDDDSYCLTTNLNGQYYSYSSLYYPYSSYSSYYYRCTYFNPTCSQCLRSTSSRSYGIFWNGFGGGPGVLKATKMRMRLKPPSLN